MFVSSLVLMSRSSSAFRTSATSSLARTVDRSLTLLAKEQTGHMASSVAPQLSPEEEQAVAAFRENQGKAARISFAEEVRTLISKSNHFGVLSTNSNNLEGYPAGSVVGFQVDEEGMPFFVFSSMSSHTTDVLKDSRCSLTILADDFKGAAEGRVALVGDVKKVFDKEKVKEFGQNDLEFHKDAFWVDFGDFVVFYDRSEVCTICWWLCYGW